MDMEAKCVRPGILLPDLRPLRCVEGRKPPHYLTEGDSYQGDLECFVAAIRSGLSITPLVLENLTRSMERLRRIMAELARPEAQAVLSKDGARWYRELHASWVSVQREIATMLWDS
jgi:hypothetical protein